MADKVLAREGRVAVRRFRRSDLQGRISWPPYTDPFYTHLNFDLSTFIEREKWLFARTVNAGRLYFAILDDNDRLIGEMSLRDVDTAARASRLGIHLAADKVGLGYGRDAMRALLSHYFTEMRWNVMYLDVAAYNYRALRLYEHLHFEHLAPFWRRVIVDESVLSDPGYADIHRFLRRVPSGIEGLHYDMALTSQRYVLTLNDTGAAPARPNPEAKP